MGLSEAVSTLNAQGCLPKEQGETKLPLIKLKVHWYLRLPFTYRGHGNVQCALFLFVRGRDHKAVQVVVSVADNLE